MTVKYDTYSKEKKEFFEKHSDFQIYTSSMDVYGRYWKTYRFENGAEWYEAMTPEYVRQEVEIKLCKTTIEVKMLRIEFWSSDNAKSKFYYEKF